MRYRLMATYRGVPYEAGIGPSEADVVLFAACPPPEELGFEPATGHWRKQLRIDEVQALWESKPTGTFRGQRCIVLDDLGDRLHIAYLGHDAYQAEQLGYWQVDRGVFELITPRDDVIDIVEERTDYPGHAEGPSTAAGPQADGAATKLADLAAATLAHLATMSHSPSRSPSRASARSAELGRSGAESLVLSPGLDPARPRAADPGPGRAGTSTREALRPSSDPLTGMTGGSSNGMAGRSVAFPGPDAPRGWSGNIDSGTVTPIRSAPGSEVAMPPPREEPLPLEAAARRAAAAATAAMRRQRRDQAAERLGAGAGPVTEAPGPEAETPGPEAETPGPEAETPGPEAETPGPEAETPGPEAETPGPEAEAPGPEAEAPGPEAEAPGTEAEAPGSPAAPDPATAAAPDPEAPVPGPAAAARPQGAAPQPTAPTRHRRTARKRDATQRIFSELAGLAAIEPTSYAVGAEVDGAMCLIQSEQGFEVFNAVAGARHEVRTFQDEESAYFYLFGVLAADAVRTGKLVPPAG